MLTMMREMLRSKFAGLLFGLIIVSMGVWGITDIFTGSLGNNVVQAGPRGFSMADFDVRLEQFLQRQREQNGIVSRQQAVERGAVDQLFAIETSRTANLGYAGSIGATATINGVMENVRQNPEFSDPISGAFDLDVYRRVLRSVQLTPAQYQELLQDDTTLGILGGAISAALEPPAAYSAVQATYLAEGRTASWFIVERADVGEPSAPTDEELQAFYAENERLFAIPERRAISVLSLSANDFIQKVEVSNDDLRAIYEAQKAQRFSGPETRRFVEVASRSEVAARDALGRLAVGASPETFTGDAVASVNTRSALRSELAAGALADGIFDSQARVGSVVGPIQQGNVWLVARIEEVIPGTPVPFDTVADLIREEYARTEAANLFEQAEIGLFNLIGAGLSLREMGAELGAPVISYVPVSQQGRMEDGRALVGLAARPNVMEAAFQARPGNVTDPVDAQNEVFLVEVQAILPPRTPELAEIRDRVESAFIAQRDADSLTQFARGLAEQIELGGRGMDEVAAGLGKPLLVTPRPISRANYDIDIPQGILVPIFGANAGDVFSVPGPGPGQMTIARLDSIAAPQPTEIQILSNIVGDELRQSLVSDLETAMETEFRNAVDFQTNPAALEAYKRQILDVQ